MKHDEFISHVRQRTSLLKTNEEAETVARTVLSALAQRLGGHEASDLAAHLPPELRNSLIDGSANGTIADLDDFLRWVANGGAVGTTPKEARDLSRAVFSTLASFISHGELDDLKSGLPASFAQLFA